MPHESIKITMGIFGFDTQIACYSKFLHDRNIFKENLESSNKIPQKSVYPMLLTSKHLFFVGQKLH